MDLTQPVYQQSQRTDPDQLIGSPPMGYITSAAFTGTLSWYPVE